MPLPSNPSPCYDDKVGFTPVSRHQGPCWGLPQHRGEACCLLNPIDLVALADPVANQDGYILTRPGLLDVGVVKLH